VGVLGGVGAGFRLASAVLAEVGPEIEGVLEFSLNENIGDVLSISPVLTEKYLKSAAGRTFSKHHFG